LRYGDSKGFVKVNEDTVCGTSVRIKYKNWQMGNQSHGKDSLPVPLLSFCSNIVA
jgi:hypothetical protein